MITNLVEIGLGIIDKVIPDPKQKEQAKLELLRQQQAGQLKQDEVALSAVIAEAKSKDKWTSRARPSFMYVMYILFLSAIPMGFLFAFKPDVATAVTNGMSAWLNGLPEELYWLFGTGYLGYTGMRTYEKGKIK